LHVLYECRAPTQPYPLSLHDALPISGGPSPVARGNARRDEGLLRAVRAGAHQGAAGLEGLLQQERQLPHVRPRGGVVRAHRLARADHGGGGGGAGEQRPHRRAGQGHHRQVVGGSGDRVGGQEDQGGLRLARRVKRGDTGAAALFLLPLLILVVGLIAYPFGRAIWLSLTDKIVGYPERFVGLRNYEYLLGDDTFHEVVRNTLVFTAGSLALKTLTGLAMALVLNAVWRGRNFFRGL